jgi:hypothetical protein
MPHADLARSQLDVQAYTVVAGPHVDDLEPDPEPEPEPETPRAPGEPQATCASGLPFVRLVRLEPASSVAEGGILRVWVRIDAEPQQRVYGGVIIDDSATGAHWHAFSFRPGEPLEKTAAHYRVESDEKAERTISVRVNPVFRDTYCTDATWMTVEVVN